MLSLCIFPNFWFDEEAQGVKNEEERAEQEGTEVEPDSGGTSEPKPLNVKKDQ